VRGQKPQQFEFLISEVEGFAVHLRRVAGLVNDDPGRANGVGRFRAGDPPGSEADAGVDLRRAGGVQNHVVDAPIRGNGRQTTFGDHQKQRNRDSRGAQNLAQRLGGGQILPRVHHDDVRIRRGNQLIRLRRDVPGAVGEQGQSGQHLGSDRRGQNQKLRHMPSKYWWA